MFHFIYIYKGFYANFLKVLTKGDVREKNIKKDRDFFYSQLMFFKKKVNLNFFMKLKEFAIFRFWNKIYLK